MLSGNRPVSAVTYLCDLKLFGLVFALPSLPEPALSWNFGSLCRAYMEAMWNLIQTHALVNFSGEERRHAVYAALLLPFRKMVYKDNKGKLVPVVNYILKVSLKRKSTDAETVVNIHGAAGKFQSLILLLQLKNEVQVEDKGEWEGSDVFEHLEYICQNDPELPATWKIRVLAEFLLRDIKELWRVALLTSLLMCTDDDDVVNLDFQLEKKREIHRTIQGTLCELCLDTIWNLKPLVDGSDIIKALQLTSRGPIIREWQHKLLAWQLVYPTRMPMRLRQNVQRECDLEIRLQRLREFFFSFFHNMSFAQASHYCNLSGHGFIFTGKQLNGRGNYICFLARGSKEHRDACLRVDCLTNNVTLFSKFDCHTARNIQNRMSMAEIEPL